MNGTWDTDLIKSLFLLIDAQRILQIPLRPGREDLIAWHHNHNGLFSVRVRSAYHVQWEAMYRERGNASDGPGNVGNNQVWKKLWDLKLPLKLKIFGWRVLQGLVPSRGILANKYIGNSSTCPLCRSDCEDIKHLLFTCDRAREVWMAIGVWGRLQDVLTVDRSGSIILE